MNFLPNNLPAFLTSTIDRARDLAHVLALLTEADHHLITIIGHPGIGKTCLSVHCGLEALDDFRDGVWFVDLAEIDNPGFFIPAIARSLETLDLPPSPDLDRLIGGFKSKTLLRILDNFEHLVEKAALDVAQILKSCWHLKILVTGRVPLHIYEENEYLLPPLTIPPRERRSAPEELMQFESVQLLVARIRQHQPQFVVFPGNVSEIVEICNILDGIPLAIELAAASLRRMTLGEMVSLLRVRNWVKEISTPARDLPQRQRTLVFLCALAGYLARSPDGDQERAAQFYGAINSFENRAGIVLGTYYQKLNQERIRLVREKLSEQEWLVAFETGRGWDRSEVIQ